MVEGSLTIEGSLTVEGSLMVSQEDDKNCDHLLTGCQAFMRHNTCHVLIGFCPGSKRRFVFCAFHIYIYHTSALSFLHFSAKTYFQSDIVILIGELSVEYLYPSSIQLSTFSYSDLVSIYFTSLSLVLFILLDFHTHSSTLLDLSVVGFVVTCRQCLVRQVISQ